MTSSIFPDNVAARLLAAGVAPPLCCCCCCCYVQGAGALFFPPVKLNFCLGGPAFGPLLFTVG